MRILWLSDRLTGPSGYSRTTNDVLKRLKEAGHQVAHIPMGSANRMGTFNFEGNVLLYESGDDPFGESVFLEHYTNFKADMLITLKEPWVFKNVYNYGINWCPWVPIDHQPVSAYITSKLGTCFKVLSMSHFGERELRQRGVENTYIPIGVDTEVYRPLDKAECKKMWFFDPDEFAVGIVARNQIRKLIHRQLRAYKLFIDRNPGVKTHLMLWSALEPMSGVDPSLGLSDVGMSILPEVMELGLGDYVKFPDINTIRVGIPEWSGDRYDEAGRDITKLYNSLDVLLNCTGGEGFSMPLIEAQAVGVPVITTDYAAGPEQVGAGLTVNWDDYIIMSSVGTRYALPSIDGMADALTKIYKADKAKLARRARAYAMNYDWKKVLDEYWTPFLNQCETDLRPMITKEGARNWA